MALAAMPVTRAKAAIADDLARALSTRRGVERWERYEVPATMCPRISEEFLAEEKRNRGE